MDNSVIMLALVVVVVVLVLALVALVAYMQRSARDTQTLIPADALADFARGLIEIIVPVAREGYKRVPGDLDDVGVEAFIEYLKRQGWYVEAPADKPDGQS